MSAPHVLVRNGILRAAARFAPDGTAPLPELGALRRVLLVYVNWRLGNNVLVTPAVQGLTERYPDTRFEFVGGPAAAVVLRGFGLDRITAISRSQLLDPVRLALFVRRLRRERYDAAIHVHSSTGTIGAFLVGMSGAPIRIGCRRSQGNVYFTSTLPSPASTHKVDRCNDLTAALGVEQRYDRTLRLDAEELRAGRAQLEELAPAGAGPRVVVFAGGRRRKGKTLPLAFYERVTERLRQQGRTPLLLFGPEEQRAMREAEARMPHVKQIRGLPVRTVAALLASCDAVLTPDSGPMHLAIAAGAPVVAMLRKADGDVWGPLPHEGRMLLDPAGTNVEGACAALDALLAL